MSGSGTGTSGHGWAAAPERSNLLALRMISWIARHAGRRVTRWLLHPISLYFLLFAPVPRRNLRRFLGRALDRPAGWRDVYRSIHAFTATTLDRVYLLGNRTDTFEVVVSGESAIDDALAAGRGAFLVGAHFGSFEVLRTIGRQRSGLRIAMVMYPDNARMINRTLQAIAPDFKPDIIPLGRSQSMLAVRDWLDAGGLAGVLADRALPHESNRSGAVWVEFLGRRAQFSDAPMRLAALLRRKVVFMVGLYRGGARYHVRFATIADFSLGLADPAQREQRIKDAVIAYAGALAEVCREQPDNWFNFHDFWLEDRPH